MTSLDLLWAVRDLRDTRLRALHKSAMTALVMHRDAGGTVRASMEQLGAAVASSPKSMRRALLDLESWGLVRVTRERLDDRRHRPNTYELVLPQGEYSQPGSTVTQGVGYSLPGSRVLPAWEGGTPRVGDSEDLSEDLVEDLSEDPLSASPPGTLDESEPGEAGKGETQKPEKAKRPTRAAEIREVFEHYLAERAKHVTGGVQPKLKPEEHKRASKLLGAGYDVDTLKLAVEGLFVDAFCVEEKRQQFFHALSEKMVDRLVEAGHGARLVDERRRAMLERERQRAAEPEPQYVPAPPEFHVEMAKLLAAMPKARSWEDA